MRFFSLANTLPEAEHFNAVGRLLKDVVRMHGLGIVVPDDFISKSISAMQNLRASDRHNILYRLAVGLDTTRPDKSDSLNPTKRMPMGLLEYLTTFFYFNSSITGKQAFYYGLILRMTL